MLPKSPAHIRDMTKGIKSLGPVIKGAQRLDASKPNKDQKMSEDRPMMEESGINRSGPPIWPATPAAME